MSDHQLIDRFLNGEEEAFTDLVMRWQDPVHRFAYRYFANRDDATEITQKTFIKVYQKLHSLSDTKKFSSWIYRITNNLCIDESRRAGRQRQSDLDLIINENEAANRVTPATRLESNELGEWIQQALLQIPAEQRTVIILKEYEGLTFREIAEVLGQPEGTVKFRMYYGLKSLRKIFNKWNIDKEALL